MKEIGGYFELELRKGKEWHNKAIALNTGRNSLELVLLTKKYTKVYIPYYTCDAIMEPFNKHNLAFEYYHININFEPQFDFKKIKNGEGFLYINYFGIKDKYVDRLVFLCPNLIIDSTQSFFSKPLPRVPTFFSCRKFFGVPDGAYLYLDDVPELDFQFDHSENRLNHLFKRIEYGANAGFDDFKTNDNRLVGQPILQMSKLTKSLLINIDYELVRKKRTENFKYLHLQLSKQNVLKINTKTINGPMVYPFLSIKPGLKKKLIDNGIYVATYWPNVLEWCDEKQLEYKMTTEIIFLPIDQRYCQTDMEIILSQIKTN